MNKGLNNKSLERAFTILSGKLDQKGARAVKLVICGGSALIATGLRARTTHDADVLALMGAEGDLVSPAPLPAELVEAAEEVARDLGLGENWLNNGPSKDDGGLFQMGLPAGLADRLAERVYGPHLTVYFIGRLDQIHFKLYAAADQRDPTHLEDLMAMKPTAGELEAAARWTMTHDVSPEFRWILQELLKELGYESVAKNI